MKPEFTYYPKLFRTLKNFLYFIKIPSSVLAHFPTTGLKKKSTLKKFLIFSPKNYALKNLLHFGMKPGFNYHLLLS